jgi:hypothetical protein
MKKMSINLKIPYVLRLIIFWLIFFISFRVLFIIYQHAKIPDDVHSETGLGFWYALPVDISVACVMASIPFVLWIFQQFYKSRLIHRINLTYNFGLIILMSLLSVTNIKMYGEWGELLSNDILKNLFYPSQSLSFFSLWSLLLLFAFSALFAYIGIRFYRNYITNFSYPVENQKKRTVQIILLALMLIGGYRIDLNIASIRGNRIHYSELEINNHIATNNIWYFANSFLYSNNTAQ